MLNDPGNVRSSCGSTAQTFPANETCDQLLLTPFNSAIAREMSSDNEP